MQFFPPPDINGSFLAERPSSKKLLGFKASNFCNRSLADPVFSFSFVRGRDSYRSETEEESRAVQPIGHTKGENRKQLEQRTFFRLSRNPRTGHNLCYHDYSRHTYRHTHTRSKMQFTASTEIEKKTQASIEQREAIFNNIYARA